MMVSGRYSGATSGSLSAIIGNQGSIIGSTALLGITGRFCSTLGTKNGSNVNGSIWLKIVGVASGTCCPPKSGVSGTYGAGENSIGLGLNSGVAGKFWLKRANWGLT
jgi:hypothetical protein